MRKLLLAAAVVLSSFLSAHGLMISSVPVGSYGGSLLASTGSVFDPDIDFHYTDSVYQDPGNPYCTMCLDFVIVATNSQGNIYIGTNVNTSGFSGYSVALAYSNTGATPPTAAVDVNGTVTFDFFLTPGNSTDPLVIYTNALGYTAGGLTFGAVTLDPPAFAPSGSPVMSSATPEPSTLALLGTGFVGLVGAVRRRVR